MPCYDSTLRAKQLQRFTGNVLLGGLKSHGLISGVRMADGFPSVRSYTGAVRKYFQTVFFFFLVTNRFSKTFTATLHLYFDARQKLWRLHSQTRSITAPWILLFGAKWTVQFNSSGVFRQYQCKISTNDYNMQPFENATYIFISASSFSKKHALIFVSSAKDLIVWFYTLLSGAGWQKT